MTPQPDTVLKSLCYSDSAMHKSEDFDEALANDAMGRSTYIDVKSRGECDGL